MSNDQGQILIKTDAGHCQVMSTRLVDLPVDVWHCLSRYLFFWHLMRLYECGSRRLVDIMTVRGGVTDAVMIFSGKNVKLGWFPRISEFLNLQLFVSDSSGRLSGNEFYPSANDLKLLPRSLKHLILRSDAAEEAFFVNFTSSDSPSSYQVGQLLNISSLWPELVTFDIDQHEPSQRAKLALPAFSVSLVNSLPATIQRVGLRNYDSSDSEFFKALPRNLLHLRHENDLFDTAIDPSSFQFLPPSLETYISPPYTRWHPTLSTTVLSQWGDLPKKFDFPLQLHVLCLS
jgi:hypothetical protein